MLEASQRGLDVFARSAHGENVAGNAACLVDDACCLPYDDFADLRTVDFRHDAARAGKIGELQDRFRNPSAPFDGDIMAIALLLDPVLPVTESTALYQLMVSPITVRI